MHRRSPRIRAITLSLIVLLILGLVPLSPAAAQPLCLDGKVWDAEAQACVALETPTPPAEEPTTAPTEPDAAPTVDDPAATGDASDDPAAEPTSPAGGDDRSGYPPLLKVFAVQCPAHLDILAAIASQPKLNCPDPVPNVTLSVTIDGASFGSRVTILSPGTVFSPLTPGLGVLQIAPFAPYDLPLAVTCLDPSGNPLVFTDATGNTGLGAIQLQFQLSHYWDCYVYFETPPTGAIVLDVHRCPNGLDIYATSPANLASSCTANAATTEFLMLTSDGVSDTFTSATSRATFARVPRGTWEIRIAPPAGFGLPVIFCETLGPAGQTLKTFDPVYVAIDGTFDVEIDNGWTILCDLYIVRGGIEIEEPASPIGGLPAGISTTAGLNRRW